MHTHSVTVGCQLWITQVCQCRLAVRDDSGNRLRATTKIKKQKQIYQDQKIVRCRAAIHKLILARAFYIASSHKIVKIAKSHRAAWQMRKIKNMLIDPYFRVLAAHCAAVMCVCVCVARLQCSRCMSPPRCAETHKSGKRCAHSMRDRNEWRKSCSRCCCCDRFYRWLCDTAGAGVSDKAKSSWWWAKMSIFDNMSACLSHLGTMIVPFMRPYSYLFVTVNCRPSPVLGTDFYRTHIYLLSL